MKTEIFVMTHKTFHEPTEPGYIPLHVGRALGQDLGYLGDHTGDHISDLNPYYGELTGFYWLWKNYSSVDIIGICHYRRFFMNDQRKLLSMEDYERILQDADIMVSDAKPGDPVEQGYAQAHNIHDLLACGQAIRTLYPEDYPFFEQILKSTRNYYGNLCVMRKDLFDNYCTWLFSVLAEAGSSIDVSGYDDYHKRVYGFLSEILLMVYIRARNLRVYEGRIGITAEKAETVEFKNAIGQLVKLGRFSEARKLFYDYQKIRPDIRLELSDVYGEIPDIEIILFILEEEEKKSLSGLYQCSQDLKELIRKYRRIKDIHMRMVQKQDVTEQEMDEYYHGGISDITKQVLEEVMKSQ